MRIVILCIACIISNTTLRAQVNLWEIFKPNTIQNDAASIRIKQVKLKYPPRGAKRTLPQTLLNSVKPLRNQYKRAAQVSFWEKINELGVTLNEVAFVNWNAGGENAASVLARVHLARNYNFRYWDWDNTLRLRYGLNAQEGQGLRKTEDQIRLTSSLGFRRNSRSPWHYSINVNLNTQFSDGFAYPNRTDPISRFMAPGYFFLGIGQSYRPKQAFTIYASPITLKSTFVLDDTLSEQGAFGVAPGQKVFSEVGFLINNTWTWNIAENITLNHRLTLYTDYLRSFGNIDADWEVDITFRVNEFINAHLGAHLIYDDDIKFNEIVAENGTIIDPGVARIQLKQVLGVGLSYAF